MVYLGILGVWPIKRTKPTFFLPFKRVQNPKKAKQVQTGGRSISSPSPKSAFGKPVISRLDHRVSSFGTIILEDDHLRASLLRARPRPHPAVDLRRMRGQVPSELLDSTIVSRLADDIFEDDPDSKRVDAGLSARVSRLWQSIS
jgi:hypothetical protein